MKEIDLKRLRDTLPERAKVKFGIDKRAGLHIEIRVHPGLYEKGTTKEEFYLEQLFELHRKIIGSENIFEFYTEETGSHWYIYLKWQPMQFVNCTDEDTNFFADMKLVENGRLVKPQRPKYVFNPIKLN